MSQTSPFRLKCMSVAYRKGFIELTTAIHEGCVNIECWQIDAGTNIETIAWVDDPSVADSSVITNCEIEMSATEARSLGRAILKAVQSMEEDAQ